MKDMKTIIHLFAILLIASSCKKSVEVDLPKGSLTDAVTYQKNATATAVLTGAIQTAMTGFSGGASGISAIAGLSADEFSYYSVAPTTIEVYQNAIAPDNIFSSGIWARAYNVIYICNVALEGISASQSADLTVPVRNQLIGEARYMRAFMYFYLVNLYGDVPLLLQSDYRINKSAARTPKAQVYAQIIADLKEAKNLLTTGYMGDNNAPSASKNRPDKAVATALLARVYLYTGDWPNAENEAGNLIADASYSLETDLSKIFLTGSREAIWQMEEGASSITTKDANYFIIQLLANVPTVPSLNTALYNSFTNGDLRKTNWTGSATSTPASGLLVYYYPFKYKIRDVSSATEKTVVLRLAEQYLIRAEARMEQPGKLEAGIADLNVIRRRAFGFPLAVPAVSDLSLILSKKDALLALENERRLELFTEWGHRWLDLKRWRGIDNPAISRADEVMPAAVMAKDGTWNTNMQYYPVPRMDIQNNSNLSQNAGYSN
jgi:hypothetical protein